MAGAPDWPTELLKALVKAYEDPSNEQAKGQGLDSPSLAVLAGLLPPDQPEAKTRDAGVRDRLYFAVVQMKDAGWVVDDSLLGANINGIWDNIRPSRKGIELAHELMRPAWVKAAATVAKYTSHIVVGAAAGAAGGALAAWIIHLAGLT